MMKLKSALLAVVAISIPLAANAAPLITNGSFETVSTANNFEILNAGTYGTLSGWNVSNSPTNSNPYNILFHSNNQTGTPAALAANTSSPSNYNNQVCGQYSACGAGINPTLNTGNNTGNYLAPSYTGPSADGGNFVALDGDSGVNGYLTQQVAGLTVGATYDLSFYWAATQLANRTGTTTEYLSVGFGGNTQTTATLTNPSQGFQAWRQVTMTFTAASGSQLLSFLSIGTPGGLPPVALLDGVSLVSHPTATVPEPSTSAMMLTGVGALALLARRRRNGSSSSV